MSINARLNSDISLDHWTVLPAEPKKLMKIAQVARLWERVSPPTDGEIELVVSHSTDDLVRRGDDVTLFPSVGEINQSKKANLLSNAAVTLSPIIRQEPFSLVMLESMASVTSVIETNFNSVAEVIVQNLSAFIYQSHENIAAMMSLALEPNCQTCREFVKNKFSVTQMVNGYETVNNKINSDLIDSNVFHCLAKI